MFKTAFLSNQNLSQMEELETYVRENLKDELEKARQFKGLPRLNDYEKALIYKYTDDGHFEINRKLRASEGQIVDEYAEYLDAALAKLDNYDDVVYRGEDEIDLEKYQAAERDKTILIEPAFLSATRSYNLAWSYGTFLFEIYSKTGKSIEKAAKFGSQTHDNEQEVLFRKGSKFRVFEVIKFSDYTLITLKEV